MAQLFDELLQSERLKALAPRAAYSSDQELGRESNETPPWMLMLTPSTPPPPLNWQNVYASALAQLESQDSTFTAKYNALSADEKEQLKLQALSRAEGAANFQDLDFEAMRDNLLNSTYVTEVVGTRFTARRDGELIIQLDRIDTPAENATATWVQMASIVAEAIFFVMAVLTAAPRPTGVAFNRAIQAITTATANNSAFRNAVNALQAANREGVWALAKGVFGVIVASNIGGLVSQVVDILLSEVAWYQYALMALQILAYIGAAFLTGGIAVIAKLASILINAAEFVLKVTNLKAIEQLAPANA